MFHISRCLQLAQTRNFMAQRYLSYLETRYQSMLTWSTWLKSNTPESVDPNPKDSSLASPLRLDSFTLPPVQKENKFSIKEQRARWANLDEKRRNIKKWHEFIWKTDQFSRNTQLQEHQGGVEDDSMGHPDNVYWESFVSENASFDNFSPMWHVPEFDPEEIIGKRSSGKPKIGKDTRHASAQEKLLDKDQSPLPEPSTSFHSSQLQEDILKFQENNLTDEFSKSNEEEESYLAEGVEDTNSILDWFMYNYPLGLVDRNRSDSSNMFLLLSARQKSPVSYATPVSAQSIADLDTFVEKFWNHSIPQIEKSFLGKKGAAKKSPQTTASNKGEESQSSSSEAENINEDSLVVSSDDLDDENLDFERNPDLEDLSDSDIEGPSTTLFTPAPEPDFRYTTAPLTHGVPTADEPPPDVTTSGKRMYDASIDSDDPIDDDDENSFEDEKSTPYAVDMSANQGIKIDESITFGEFPELAHAHAIDKTLDRIVSMMHKYLATYPHVPVDFEQTIAPDLPVDLEISTTSESHTNPKVKMTFHVDHFNLPEEALDLLQALSGARYKPSNKTLVLSCSDYTTIELNKKYLLQLFERLLTETVRLALPDDTNFHDRFAGISHQQSIYEMARRQTLGPRIIHKVSQLAAGDIGVQKALQVHKPVWDYYDFNSNVMEPITFFKTVVDKMHQKHRLLSIIEFLQSKQDLLKTDSETFSPLQDFISELSMKLYSLWNHREGFNHQPVFKAEPED